MSSSPFLSSSCPTYNNNNSALQSAGYIDSTGNLVAAHDAATAHLGAPWRMPTSDEIQALLENCTTTWITTNGVYGRLVTGKGAYANRSIFLPAAGYGDISNLYDPGSDGGGMPSLLAERYCRVARPQSLLVDLIVAYRDARRHKRSKFYQTHFEMNQERELVSLRDELIERRYMARPSSCFIIHDPKMREVFAPYRKGSPYLLHAGRRGGASRNGGISDLPAADA